MGRGLHDEIGQPLTAVKMYLQRLQKAQPLAGAPGLAHDSLDILEQMLKHVRELSLDLHPSLLDDLGLVPGVRWFATRQASRASWTFHFTISDD